jgi:8-oxo-dGTP diphosphatase
VSSRLYPARPIVGVGGIILDGSRVVLIKRKYEPLANRWSLPGGSLEVGEHLEDGAARELREETGLIVEVGPVVEVFDRIQRDEDGRVRYHFVLVDYLCRPAGGRLEASDDVSDARWVEVGDLPRYELTEKTVSVIVAAQRLAAAGVIWKGDGQ